MALTGKKLEAAKAIAAANPTWSKKHVDMCADFLMPTSTECYFDEGTAKREAARQLFKERMTAFLVEMNILPQGSEYVRPDDWKSPYSNTQPRAHRVTKTAGTQATTSTVQSSTPKEQRPAGAVKEPRPGSAGAKAWAVCDAFYAEHQRCPTGAEARAAGEAAGLNPGNVGTEASVWRRFHGYQK